MKKVLMTDQTPTAWHKRVLWFIALWIFGVSSLAVVAYGLRLFMRAIGLTL